MKANEPELMWARQHWTGMIWEDSLACTAPIAHRFPEGETWDAETTEAERAEKWGEVKLFRVTLGPVSPEEQASHLAKQEEFFKRRRTPTEPPKEQQP